LAQSQSSELRRVCWFVPRGWTEVDMKRDWHTISIKN
jgi:hypothetical protein